ncbi:MAG: hypothetical protein HY397_02880 [Candidatus Doudnabacteria bacterium]|nr:hypothetical protein [Candidatus Doudnabacteria bacterium]
MNKIFFDSYDKRKILTVLMHYPNRSFSATEIGLRTGTSTLRAKNLLQAFAKQHLANSFDKSPERYFRINRRSMWYPEIEKILEDEKLIDRPVVERLILALPNLKFAALSGLFVGRPKAQIDLLLAGDVSEERAERVAGELKEIVGNEVNYALMSEQEFLNRLYSYDWSLKEVLDYDPLILLDRLTVRKNAKGTNRVKFFYGVKK